VSFGVGWRTALDDGVQQVVRHAVEVLHGVGDDRFCDGDASGQQRERRRQWHGRRQQFLTGWLLLQLLQQQQQLHPHRHESAAARAVQDAEAEQRTQQRLVGLEPATTACQSR